MVGTNIVQYSSLEDYPAAKALADGLGYDLVQSDDISGLQYHILIMVGGQDSNPVFKAYCDQTHNFRYVYPYDEGYIMIQYHNDSQLLWTKEVWGVASWTTADTLASANYLLQFAQQHGYLFRYGVRTKVGTQPPSNGGGGGTTPQISLQLIIDTIMAGAIGYAGGAALLIGSSFIESKYGKIIGLAGIGFLGYGGYKSYEYLKSLGF